MEYINPDVLDLEIIVSSVSCFSSSPKMPIECADICERRIYGIVQSSGLKTQRI